MKQHLERIFDLLMCTYYWKLSKTFLKSQKKIHQIFLKLKFYYVIPMQGLQKS